MRECEGVYQFGSKKIYIKIEGDKILSNFCLSNMDNNVIIVRVGGGFLTIEEFIRQNGNQEYDRLAKNGKFYLGICNLSDNKIL